MLHIVGACDERIFGLTPARRLEKQMNGREGVALVAHASAVMDDAALEWLIDHGGTILASPSGRPLAVVSDPGETGAAADALLGNLTEYPVVIPSGDQFVRKLRRRVKLGAYSLLDEPARTVEKQLFDKVYKGVTDLVTKWLWPWPAFLVTRLAARAGITPNMVTATGIALVFVAGWLFYQGQLASGITAAWLMTFLDTVDGKLARVTVTSSKFGNILDHGTDIIHPPIWWYCLAHGVAVSEGRDVSSIIMAFWIILACYVMGRIVEEGFKRRFGINQYIWRPFDSRLRLIVARRNTILLLMTVALLAGAPAEGFWVSAAWSIVSVTIQLARFGQASAESRRGRIVSWLT